MKQYKLVFFDDFEGTELNHQHWNVIDRERNPNREDQYYTPDNYYLKDSLLVIQARRETKGSKLYTSARLDTYQKVSIKYGRVEVRAKIPLGRGTWPAIWMMGDNARDVGWPKCGEIDIMEHVGYNPGFLNSWIHVGSKNHTSNSHRGMRTRLNNVDQFHTYAMEWGEDYLEIFIDDVRTFLLRKQKDDTTLEWPFDQPFFLILNLAIGGHWGGARGIDDTIFPLNFEIDYVKMYQIENNQLDIDLDDKRIGL